MSTADELLHSVISYGRADVQSAIDVAQPHAQLAAVRLTWDKLAQVAILRGVRRPSEDRWYSRVMGQAYGPLSSWGASFTVRGAAIQNASSPITGDGALVMACAQIYDQIHSGYNRRNPQDTQTWVRMGLAMDNPTVRVHCVDLTAGDACDLTGAFSSYADFASGIEQPPGVPWPAGDWRWFRWRDPPLQPTMFAPPLKRSLDLAVQLAQLWQANPPVVGTSSRGRAIPGAISSMAGTAGPTTASSMTPPTATAAPIEYPVQATPEYPTAPATPIQPSSRFIGPSLGMIAGRLSPPASSGPTTAPSRFPAIAPHDVAGTSSSPMTPPHTSSPMPQFRAPNMAPSTPTDSTQPQPTTTQPQPTTTQPQPTTTQPLPTDSTPIDRQPPQKDASPIDSGPTLPTTAVVKKKLFSASNLGWLVFGVAAVVVTGADKVVSKWWRRQKRVIANPRKETIYEALVRKLGRVPTNAELKADVERIKQEALQEVAAKGRLRHQRKRRAS